MQYNATMLKTESSLRNGADLTSRAVNELMTVADRIKLQLFLDHSLSLSLSLILKNYLFLSLTVKWKVFPLEQSLIQTQLVKRKMNQHDQEKFFLSFQDRMKKVDRRKNEKVNGRKNEKVNVRKDVIDDYQ